MTYKVDQNEKTLKVAGDTNPYTLTLSDETYLALDTQDIYLPTLSTAKGRSFTILTESLSTGVTINAQSGDDIEGEATLTLTNSYESVTFIGGQNTWGVSGRTGVGGAVNSTSAYFFKAADGNTNNTGTQDFGFYVERSASSWAGWGWDESADKWVSFTSTSEPTTLTPTTKANIETGGVLCSSLNSTTSIQTQTLSVSNDVAVDSTIYAAFDIASGGVLLTQTNSTTYTAASTDTNSPTLITARVFIEDYIVIDVNDASRFFQLDTASNFYTTMNSSKSLVTSRNYRTTNVIRVYNTGLSGDVTLKTNTGVSLYKHFGKDPVSEVTLYYGEIYDVHIIQTSSTTIDILIK
jgi:hypothetical protein